MQKYIYGWAVYPLPITEQQRNGNAFEMMVASAKENGIRLDILFAEEITLTIVEGNLGVLYKGREVEKPLFVVMRCYDVRLSQHLEFMGVRLFNNSASMSYAQDKVATHQLLAMAGIPTPRTYWGVGSYAKACYMVGNDTFIVKSPIGSKGEAVYMVSSEAEFNNYPNTLVQEYVNESYGRDIRVWVIGSRAVAAVERFNNSSFLSNYAQGGSARIFELTEEVSDLAVRSSMALGLEFSGVDILYAGDGKYTVCEVNGNAGFRTLWLTERSINMLYELFKYIKESLL